MPPFIPSNEHFPIICIRLGSRSHYQLTYYRAPLRPTVTRQLPRPRWGRGRAFVPSVPRAPAGSAEGETEAGARSGSPPCPIRVLGFRDFQDCWNLSGCIPLPPTPPLRCHAKASLGGTAPSTELASPCPGSRGCGERDLAGAAAVGAGSSLEACGWLAGGGGQASFPKIKPVWSLQGQDAVRSPRIAPCCHGDGSHSRDMPVGGKTHCRGD